MQDIDTVLNILLAVVYATLAAWAFTQFVNRGKYL